MSKQRQKPTISNRLRRGLAGILSLALLIGLLPATVIPAEAATHWATPYVNTLVDWGVMRGDISGNMAPERSITRAEFVAMMNRAYGYTRTAGHPFTDVRVRDWYNDDIDIGYNMGYFKGTSPTTASPNARLTREQAAVLLARNMMLQPTVGETLGFSDSRTLSDWSRDLVGAAAENGILGGYSDGSFKPQASITRGEVAAMLVRAIGTPIQTEGDHTLGNVYGNVTVNTSGVRLRDGIITGNLYLTGGIDLGDVLMENITVLGEIIVSGGGESNSSQSSIVLRNVTAKAMTVDSISGQFVTIRAEGNTDIKETTVRTSAYVDDSSLPGYGLWKIIQDGGSLLQLAGNAKEVINKTPNSELQVVQGVADKVTIDEKATGSSVLVDGDARVDELDLDVATTVTGEGDIKDLNVGAAGSTVEQLPDNVTIRPGITADVNGSEMNSSQAAEASSEPRLLAGYPRAKNVAPTSATLVFSVNKPGTIYWAVSAVSDGSVSEADLIENPAYGGKIIQAGTITAEKAATEYTADVANLAMDGSYYISAILVDGRDRRSPVKVAAFSTPDGTKPAFIGNPTATLRSTQTAQVTGMPNKSCQLFWALLPQGAAAPTPAEFKANAVRGNLGYGSIDVTKNVSQSINVNNRKLAEKTNYVAYLWLTDYDGAQSSQVYAVPIYIPDETPPELGSMRQTNSNANSVETSFTMNEAGRLYWSIITDEMHDNKTFLGYDDVVYEPGPSTESTNAYLDFGDNEEAALAAKIAVTTGTGAGAIVSGSTPVTAANALTRIPMNAATGLDPAVYNTSTFYIYYVGVDSENPGNLSKTIGVKEVNVLDSTKPYLAEQRFDTYNPSDLEHPLATTSIDLIFSESIRNGPGTKREQRFWDLYKKVEDLLPAGESNEQLKEARDNLAEALHDCIRLYMGDDPNEVSCVWKSDQLYNPNSTVLNYRYATVSRENGTGRMIISFPHNALGADGKPLPDASGDPIHAVNLKSGATYHFEVYNVYDCAAPQANPLEANSACMTDHDVDEFRVAFAQVSLKSNGLPGIMYNAERGGVDYFKAVDDPDSKYGKLTYPAAGSVSTAWQNNPPQRMDGWFTVTPVDLQAMQDDPDSRYDILFWADRDVEVSIYSRPTPTGSEEERDQATWTYEGTAKFEGTPIQTEEMGGNGYVYRSLTQDVKRLTQYPLLSTMDASKEYAIHVDMLHFQGQDNLVSGSWADTVHFRISVVAGSRDALGVLNNGSGERGRGLEKYNSALRDSNLSSLGLPDYAQSTQIFDPSVAPLITDYHYTERPNDPTNPEITVTLDIPGFCTYIILELTDLRYASTAGNLVPLPTGMVIDETMITGSSPYKITSYSPVGSNVYDSNANQTRPELADIPNLREPGKTLLMTVETPAASAVVGSIFPATVQRGVTTSMSGQIPQDIVLKNPLKPNTIYLLCVVPQGESGSQDSRSQETYCFRFTTGAPTAPILYLRDDGSVNVNATTDCTAQVSAILLRQSNISDPDSIFQQKLSGKIPGTNVDLMVSPAPDGASGYANYTVLRALQEVYGGTVYGPSVFDVLASDALKQQIMSYVESGATTGLPPDTRIDTWGPQQVPQRPTDNNGGDRRIEFDSDKASGSEYYVCIGVAYTSVDGPRGFRALPNLQLVDRDPPKVTGVSNTLWYDETDKHYKGTVTIAFDKELFIRDRGTQLLYAVAQSNGTGAASATPGAPLTVSGANYTVNGVTKNDYIPLNILVPNSGPGVTIPNQPGGVFTTIQSVTFSVDSTNPNVSITFGSPFVSAWGYAQPTTIMLTLTYDFSNGTWSTWITPGVLAPGTVIR